MKGMLLDNGTLEGKNMCEFTWYKKMRNTTSSRKHAEMKVRFWKTKKGEGEAHTQAMKDWHLDTETKKKARSSIRRRKYGGE